MTTAGPPGIAADQLAELLELVRGADSVELKLTVPEPDQRSTMQALGMDPLEAQIKLRPVVPAELPVKLRRSPAFGVEVDAMLGGFVCSGSLKNALGDAGAVNDGVAGRRALRKLFSKDQRAFFATHAPEGIELDELEVLGPIFVLKLKFSPAGFARKRVAEMWLYPDESRILELSTKSLPSDAFLTAAQTRAYLAQRGVDLAGEQETKTKRALEFFTARLKESA